VAGAIRRKAGPSVQTEALKLAPIEIGTAVVTGAGQLKAKYVIHAATMGMNFKTNQEIIRKATRNSLKIAEENKIASISFPALGCGVGGFSPEMAAKILVEETVKISPFCSFLKKIVCVLYDQATFKIFREVVNNYTWTFRQKIAQHPLSTADAIIKMKGGIVLVKRKNPPAGWALPGGFVKYNESLEQTVRREIKEETNLTLEDLKQFHTYSAPDRDPRFHTITTVFVGKGKGRLKASSDAAEVAVFPPDQLPAEMAFDHRQIIQDFLTTEKKT
jgi:ADP-ribose pyrophosphatase YjhB (NUDIX family)/O-acetyl-ADP-ribose deacetylase (regulator of RNase III)